jgi:hypothetical protein
VKWEADNMRWSFVLYLIVIFGGLAYMALIGLVNG